MNANGDCMKIACENAIDNKEWKFCYGYVSGQGKLKGIRFIHAWNELGEIVFDFSNGRQIIMSKKDYYDIGEINNNEVIRQSASEVRELILKYKTYGGWIKNENVVSSS